MTINEKFEVWWDKVSCRSGHTSPFEGFIGGWSVGFREQQEASNLREKLILDELLLHLPKGFDMGMAIVSAVTKG